MASEIHETTIRPLLENLAAMNFEPNPQRCVNQLAKLTGLGVCRYQRLSVRVGVFQLVQSKTLENSAQGLAGPMISRHPVKPSPSIALINEQDNALTRNQQG